jgi:hypothetical protein
MKAWLVGVSATALLAAGFYLAAPKPAEPIPPAPAPEAATAAPVQQPAMLPPAILDHVTDVTDIDHLLEPPPIPTTVTEPGPVITRVGYEEPATATTTPATAPPIPKSLPEHP